MREILFRGKVKRCGDWVYGDLVRVEMGFTYIRQKGVYHSVDPSTVGQYTGLTDKNGNKIFEGDIVDYKGDLTLEVMFKCGMYVLIETYGGAMYYFDGLPNNGLDIIGNIYDNPELLKGGDKC